MNYIPVSTVANIYIPTINHPSKDEIFPSTEAALTARTVLDMYNADSIVPDRLTSSRGLYQPSHPSHPSPFTFIHSNIFAQICIDEIRINMSICIRTGRKFGPCPWQAVKAYWNLTKIILDEMRNIEGWTM